MKNNEDKKFDIIRIVLKYEKTEVNKKVPAISEIKRVSKEGKRIYIKKGDIKNYMSDSKIFGIEAVLYDIYRRNVPRKIQLAGILKEIGDQPYKLAPNKFPYDLLLKNLPNVRQYCLWSLSGSLTVDQIEKIINTDFPGLQYFWFENHLKYKSIPEIWHCCDRRNRY